MLGIEEIKAQGNATLRDYFHPWIAVNSTALSRMRGDWKKTLTAQVIKYARRKGLVEELEIQIGSSNWLRACRAIFHGQEFAENETNIQPSRD